jgi:hypothetical protein
LLRALLFAAVLSPAANAAPADPVAVIAAVKGHVEITPRGGSAQRAAFGRALERGDRIAVSAGGSATVFFNDGNVIELAEKSTLTVSGKIANKAAGPAAGLPGEVYASVSRFVAGGSRASGLLATSTLRGADEQPFLMSPRRTAVLTDRPAFAWREVAGARRYRVTVSSAEQGELWKQEVEGLTLDWPSDAPPIPGAGDFLWEVEALGEAGPLRRESSVFQALAPAQVATIRGNLERIRETAGGPGSAAARFLAASYLSGLGLYQDAVEHFGALSRLSPTSPAPHDALGDLYTKVGLMDLAAAEYQRANALTREP